MEVANEVPIVELIVGRKEEACVTDVSILEIPEVEDKITVADVVSEEIDSKEEMLLLSTRTLDVLLKVSEEVMRLIELICVECETVIVNDVAFVDENIVTLDVGEKVADTPLLLLRILDIIVKVFDGVNELEVVFDILVGKSVIERIDDIAIDVGNIVAFEVYETAEDMVLILVRIGDTVPKVPDEVKVLVALEV